MKIPTKDLPSPIKRALSEGGFSKRLIEVKVNSMAKVHGSTHAPEYDNFDYGYSWMSNAHSGGAKDLQEGLKPNASKEVHLGNDDVLIDGDKHGNFATLTVNQGTYDKYFKASEAKVATVFAQVLFLEKRLAIKIHEQASLRKQQMDDANQAIQDLERYLHSSKFHTDTTVQVKDILNRLESVKDALREKHS